MSVVAILISLGALGFSIFTFIWRDTYRGKVRMWFPQPERGLPEDTKPPYADIVNHSPFDIRVARFYVQTKDGNKYDLPGPFGDDERFPADIDARRSKRVELHATCFFDLVGQEVDVFAETDTGKRFGTSHSHKKQLLHYIKTVVSEEEQKLAEVDRRGGGDPNAEDTT